MPGVKRPIEHQVDGGDDNVHPSRKRRLEDGQDRQELGKIFNDLRDEIAETRLEATKTLLKTLSVQADDQAGKLDYSTTRLIRGVCSGAKAARPGFSIALIEVLRLGFASGHLKLVDTVDKIVALTNLESKLSGAEQRDYLIGRRSAFQAVLQSGVLAGKAATEDAKHLFDAIANLALEKEWLRSECGAMLHMFLISQEATQLSNDSIRTLIDSLKDKDLLKTPEGVAIWSTVKKSFSKVKLPKGVWNHNNPLSSQERPTLSKILLKGAADPEVFEQPAGTNGAPNGAANGAPKKGKKQAGARQSAPNFAWQVILGYLYEGTAQKFGAFWEDCVGKAMFSKTASDERKNLGLQIFKQALASAPAEYLGYAIDAHIIKCIVDQRAHKGLLNEATKAPLNQIAKRGKEEPAAAAAMACKLLALLPPNMDKLERATVDALLAAADSDGLADIVASIVTLIRTPGDGDEGKRRSLADALATIVRSHKAEPTTLLSEGPESLAEWLQGLLRSLTHLAYTTSDAKCSPPLSALSRSIFKERLTSCLGHLATLPLHQAILAPTLVLDTLHESRKTLTGGLDETTATVCKEARKHFKTAAKQAAAAQGSAATIPRAFQLLLALGMLQVYKQEPEAESILEDIIACYVSPADADETSAAMLTELLLSFVSKNSRLYSRMAEQVFAAFAPDVTAEALQSMVDILSQKESLAGQQELFAEDDAAEGGADDEEMIDVEDESDFEVVNGNVAGDSDDSSSCDEGSDEANDDEEAVFDRNLAAALGTTGMDDEENEDGSDMDDDQMEALDSHLSTIFKERSKTSSKKKDKEDAKENIVQFKNKVLDLLSIYVKSQYENVLALDLMHPLVALTRESTNQQTQRKAMDVLEQYFDSCKKNKTSPKLDSSKAGFKLLTAIHTEMRLGGSKLHASACSRSSQFLAKVLTPLKPGNWKKISSMYGDLMEEWREDPKSKIHPSIFNEWHSWCMQK